MKKWVLFDLDGTLTDPMIGITSAVQYALKKFGIEVTYLKELIPFIGPPLKDSFMKYYHMSSEDAEKAVAYYREYYGPRGIYENKEYPGMKEMLSHLEEAGFDLAVATTKPTVYAEEILKHFGMRDYFTLIVGSELDGRRSDKEELITYILRRAQIASSEAIMVGDRSYDIIGACACGLDSIGVLYGYGSKEELKEAGATALADSVDALERKIFEFLEREQRGVRRLGSWKRSQPEPVMPVSLGKRVRFGLLGTGQNAELFCKANHFGRQFSLTAICGPTMAQTTEFAYGKGQVLCMEEKEDLAACREIDAVYISCGIKERADAIRLMLRAGKHVLSQAPMAENLREMEELYALAEEKDLILMEGYPFMYAPAFEQMQPYLASLGKIRQVTFEYCHNDICYEQYKRGVISPGFNPERSAGCLMEEGVYPVAAMVRLFGPPESVSGTVVKLANGIDVCGTILMGYEDMIGQVVCSKITDSAAESQIQGEEGSMLIRQIDNIKDLRIRRRKVDQSIHFEQSDNILHHETNAFIHMIHTGIGTKECKELSLSTMEVLEKAQKNGMDSYES